MLTDQENVELGLAEEGSLSRAVGLDFYSFPIVDRSVPPSRGDFEEFASQILGVVSKGGRGILHCRAGLGRAPLLGCAVLVQNGVEADVAWNMIQNSRGQPVPDTDEQKAWIKKSGVAVVSLDDALSKLMDGDA